MLGAKSTKNIEAYSLHSNSHFQQRKISYLGMLTPTPPPPNIKTMVKVELVKQRYFEVSWHNRIIDSFWNKRGESGQSKA